MRGDQKSQNHRNQCWKGPEEIMSGWTKADLIPCNLILTGIFTECSWIPTSMDILQLTYSNPSLSCCFKCFPDVCLTLPCTSLRPCVVLFPVHKRGQICQNLQWYFYLFLYHNPHLDFISVENTLANQSVIPHRLCEIFSSCKSGSRYREKQI